MRRKILSKALAAVLCAAMILPVMSGGFQAKAAEETTTIEADFSASHSNWGAIEGTGTDVATYDGMMRISGGLSGNASYTLKNWPDLPLKKVTIEVDSMLLNNSNASVLKLFYRYNGAEDYEAVQLRNNSSGNWYLPPTIAKGADSSGGQSNDTREDTFTPNGKYNTSSSTPSTMERGATIVLDYSEAGYCKITLRNADGQEGTMVIKAVGQSFNTNGMKFAMAIDTGSGTTNYANIESVTFEFDGVIVGDEEAQAEADAFRTAHAAILAKTVDTVKAADRAAVETALTAYASLSSEAQLLLTTEKAKLDALKTRIDELSQAEGGYREYDFEEETDLKDWEAVKDEAEGWGITDNPKQGINTSGKVFLPLAKAQPDNPNNPWQGGYPFDTGGVQGADPVYTLTDAIWAEETAGGQKLASVSGDLYTLSNDWNNGIMFIYWYQDAANYKAVYIRRENTPDTHNVRTGADYCYSVRKVTYSGDDLNAYEANAIKPGSTYSTVPANTSEWLHFVFDYAEDGSYCEFTLMDAYGNAETYMLDQNASGGGKTEAQVKLNEGKFAVSTMVWADAPQYYSYVDNISFNFSGSVKDAAECYKAEYARTIGMDAGTLMPEDQEEIAAAFAAYDALDAEAQGFLTVEKGKLDALSAAAAKWTDDLAGSYQKIHASALALDADAVSESDRKALENAWNVLRRLPAAVQTELETEAAGLEAALKALEGSGSKKPVEIACIGDSITTGDGISLTQLTEEEKQALANEVAKGVVANLNDSHAKAKYNWPTQLGELLGEGYVVRNYGVSGVQAAMSYTGTTEGDNLQLENTRTDAWMTSHVTQADVVILMLGTNDASKVCPNGTRDEAAVNCYKDAMKAIIRSYQALPTSPTIILATSPTRGAEGTNYDIQAAMYEVQKELIEELGLPSVDIYAVSEAWEAEGTTDTNFSEDDLHFTKDGYADFAAAFAEFFEGAKIGFQTDNGGLTYVYFEEGQTEPEPGEPTITGVTVAPTEAKVHVGKTGTFTANVSGTGDYNKNVTWSVTGNLSTATKIENGTLTVGEDEKAATLTVTATSAGDSTKSAAAIVTVEQHDFTGDYETDATKHWKVCSICQAVGEQEAHDMGDDWTADEDGDTHTRSCICGRTETEAHDYGEAVKVNDTQHKYICADCGHEKFEDHAGADEWQSDADGHWHECEICGMLEESKIAHTPGQAATETTPQTCTECGYVIEEALGHEHTAAAEWQYDENKHWHGCAGCEDETVKFEEAEHTYGEWTVTEEATETEPGSRQRSCTECGYIQMEEIPVLEHTHQYGEDWKSDGTGHWHVCACGEMDEVIAHTYGEWTVTKEPTSTETRGRERTCSVCGYTQEEVLPVIAVSTAIEVDTQENQVQADVSSINIQTVAENLGVDLTAADTKLVVEQSQQVAAEDEQLLKAQISEVGYDFLNIYDVSMWLLAAGKNPLEVLDNFGSLKLSFYAGTEYAGKLATVYQLHGTDEVIPYKNLTIDANGMVTITVTKLSAFAVALQQTEDTEPKTGENFPAAALLTLMLASAAVGTVLVVKRRRGAI